MRHPDDNAATAATARITMAHYEPEGSFESREDDVAVEEPLEVLVNEDPMATTMRTPGHDEELVAGLLWAEGLIDAVSDILGISLTPRPRPHLLGTGARAHAALTPNTKRASMLANAKRGTLTSAACGVCGRGVLDDLLTRLQPVQGRAPLDVQRLAALTKVLQPGQPVFQRTGGLHAAAVVGPNEETWVVREDVGRHNAVDKAIGRLVLDGRTPAPGCTLVVSGRTSFEIVQKAIRAGMTAVVGISAPSSLAIELAEAFGVALLGFARHGACNVYTQPPSAETSRA